MTGIALFTGALITGTAVLFRWTQQTAEAGDEAAKAAKRIGITSVEFQELAFAAELSGAEMTDVEVAFRRLAVSARDASEGIGPSAEAFAALGVSATDAEGELKPQIDLFTELAEALSQLENDTLRMALANDIFGRGGARILPLLSEGADGIEAMREEARLLGFVLDEEAAEAAERFVDAQSEVKKVLEGLRNTIGIALIPVFTEMLEGFRDWFIANRDIIKQRLERTAERIAAGLRSIGTAIRVVDRFVVERLGGWEKILIAIGVLIGTLASLKIFASLVTLVQGIAAAFSIVAGIGAVAFGEIIAVVVAVVAVLALLFLAVEDLIVFMRGGDSVIGAFFERFDQGNQVLPKLQELFDAARQAGGSFLDIVLQLGKALGTLLGPVLEALQPLLEFFLFALASAADVELARQIQRITDWTDALLFLSDALERVSGFLTQFLGGAETAGDVLGGLALAREDITGTAGGQRALAGLQGTGFGAVESTLGGLLGAFAPPRAGGGATSRSTSATVGDLNLTINAPGADAQEVARLVQEQDESRRRQTADMLRGGDI